MKKSLHLLPWTLLLVFLFIAFGCQPPAEEGLTDVEAKAFVDKVLGIWNTGNLDSIAEAYAPEIVVHTSSTPDAYEGYEGLNTWVTNTRTAFPDFNMTFDEMIVQGDKIATRWTATGTHTGTLAMLSGELPPTGKEINITGLAINRFENGKSVSELVSFNVLDMLQQLGFSIAPPQPAEPEEIK